MRLASVSLPQLRLSSNEQHLNFSLEGSLRLRFPDGVEPPRTSSDLLKLVTEMHLWIARTGSCYFDLVVSIQGEPVSKGDQMVKLMEWVQNCEVWSRVGVRLQGRERDAAECPARTTFSIQHPDLSSALVTPRDAFTAEFQAVTCHVNLSPVQDAPLVSKRSLKRKRERVKQIDRCIENQQLGDLALEDEDIISLTPDDRRAIDAFIQSLNMAPTQHGRHKSAQRACRSDGIQEKIEFSERLRQLFDVALEMLVLGSGKQYKGITAIECTRAECLTRLAPAVFYMPYLKTISDRASLLPIIATSLARMKNAESPSLRHKAISFAARVTDENCDHGDRVIRGIEKSTWVVLLSAMKMPSRPRKASRGVKRATPNMQPKSGAESCKLNILPRAMETKDLDDAGSMATLVDAHSQMENNYEVRQFFFLQDSPEVFESQQRNLSGTQTNNLVLLPGPYGYYAAAGASHGALDLLEMNNKPVMGGLEYQVATDFTMLNREPSPLDLRPYVAFDEWLCSGESMAENRGIPCEAVIPYQTYEDVDISFYKSYEHPDSSRNL
ncbi:hypothetical protein V8C37DRAFT_365222 [Trichoderma ceciliae]